MTSPLVPQPEVKVRSHTMQVPFHRASLGEEEIHAVSEVLRSGWITMGPRTFEFEREFARYVGAEHAVAVSTGTAALHLALEAAGIGAGDEVLLPTTTFTATAEAVIYTGARPVLVDIDPLTMNIDPEDAARRITGRSKAIIPVHLGGQPCDLQQLHSLARQHSLRVIEDAAHALPSEYQDRKIGQISEFTCFSFYATKTLTTGEGGMITTNNPAAAERMRLMRLHGIERDAWKRYRGDGSWFYQVLEAGFKYNITDIQSAMGVVQLAKCDAMKRQREAVAARYLKAFSNCEELVNPTVLEDRQTSWHLYVLRLRLDRLSVDRNSFVDSLARQGVSCSVHFIPLHLQPFYREAFGYGPGCFPAAEREYRSCFSLPIFPCMTDAEITHVIDAVFHSLNESRTDRLVAAHVHPGM
jgi:dTDP-4-amino-4,6-dideoxygalactose transaminase